MPKTAKEPKFPGVQGDVVRYLQASDKLFGEGVNITTDLINAVRQGSIPGLGGDQLPEELTKIQRNKRLPLKDVMPGMVVGQRKRDLAGKTVLERGDVLGEQNIARLKNFGVEFVHVVVEESLVKKSDLRKYIDLRKQEGVMIYLGQPAAKVRVTSGTLVTGFVLLGSLVEVYYQVSPAVAMGIGAVLPLIALVLYALGIERRQRFLASQGAGRPAEVEKVGAASGLEPLPD